jgi:hypothetical protein
VFERGLERLLPVSDSNDLVIRAKEPPQISPHVGVVVGQDDPGPRSVTQIRRRVVLRHKEASTVFWSRIRQPSERLFNERAGSESRGLTRSAGADAIWRKVFFAQRDGDSKSATFAVNAFNSNGSTMHLGEFLDQRKTDARPFEGASPGALNPVKPIENVWEFRLGDSRAGVPDR